jgi:hypothetical protein
MVTTASEPTSSSVALRLQLGVFFSRINHTPYSAGCMAGACRPAPPIGASLRRLPRMVMIDVPGHDEAAGEVEHAAEGTHDVVGEHGEHGFGEGIDEEALLVVFAPHQALLDAGTHMAAA